MVDRILTSKDSSFEKLENKNSQESLDSLQNYDAFVITENNLYGANGSVSRDEFERQHDEEVLEVHSYQERGSATGHSITDKQLNQKLEEYGHSKRVNPEGTVFEPGWSTELDEDYLEPSTENDPLVQRAARNYEEEREASN